MARELAPAEGEAASGYDRSHAERWNDQSQLSYVDVPLCALALAAVQVAKVPDLLGWKRCWCPACPDLKPCGDRMWELACLR